MLTIISLQHVDGRANPLEINRHHIKIGIKNQLVTTKVDQVFVNPNNFESQRYVYLPRARCCSRFKPCPVH